MIAVDIRRSLDRSFMKDSTELSEKVTKSLHMEGEGKTDANIFINLILVN
jgi:hypothetical protein